MSSLVDKFPRIVLKLLTRLEASKKKQNTLNEDSEQLAKVIYVTSAVAEEGKSFIAQAIAKCLTGLSVYKVLLIDSNMDSPSGLVEGPGLAEYVSGDSNDVFGSIVSLEHFDFLPAGEICKPGLLYQYDKVNNLLKQFSGVYDIVIVDGASLLKSGSNSFAHQSDGIVLVVKGDDTSQSLIKEAMRELNVDSEKYLGAILNQRPKYIPKFLYKKLG